MNEFDVNAKDAELTLLRQIADEMISNFGIDRDEANGRIRRQWGGMEFRSKYAYMALRHRDAHEWAYQIYYNGQMWWLDGVELTPTPYP
ncbi:hypothetical protein ACQP2E_17355 [Actinoplanes sp. CA-015351]|uniref:hypothetical protein n=1 Tax=Actinoplanes sp. CA-015351 TaxID=3239897 RepID=UPI003D970EBA